MKDHVEGVSRMLSLVLAVATALIVVSAAASWQAPRERAVVMASATGSRG